MEAGKEFMKGKDVFVSTLESPSATVVCHLCSTSYASAPDPTSVCELGLVQRLSSGLPNNF